MHLSVVVPTYNQAELLQECLRSLVDQTLDPGAYEIIVVDDGSTDRTAAVIEEFRSRVKFVHFSANRGRSAARNAGIQQAAAPLIVFADSDVIVRRDFLQWHLRTHRRNGPGILSRGPVALVPDVAKARDGRMARFATSPAYLDTANAALEKSALLTAGMFDEGFPGYGWEDFELGLRLRRLGVRRVYCSQAVAFHVQPQHHPEAIDDLLHKEEARARSAVYFFRKHPTIETRVLVQATAVHRGLYWLQSGCGILTPENIFETTTRMRAAGLAGLAHLALRGVLNRHYMRTLTAELRRHAPAVA